MMVPVKCIYCGMVIDYEDLPPTVGNIIWSICKECQRNPLRRMRYMRGGE